MKKLLSFVIVAMMVVSLVVPTFAVAEAPTAEIGTENTVAVYMLDTTVDVSEQNTVTLTFYLAGNDDGFEYLKFFVVYPECLTRTRAAIVAARDGGILDRGDFEAGVELQGRQKVLEDAFDTLGLDPAIVADAPVKYTCPFIDAERYDDDDFDGDDDYDEAYELFGDGALYTLTFTYDAAANTDGTHEFDIDLYPSPDDCQHCDNPDYEWDGQAVNLNVYGGKLTLLFDDPIACEHTNTEERIDTPATCTEPGSKSIVCSDCGEVLQTGIEIPAEGHVWGEWYTTVDPTETTAGEERRDCTKCDAFETNVLDPIPHEHVAGEPQEVITKNPNCTETGLKHTEVRCTVCGEIIETGADEEIPALGHTKGAAKWKVRPAVGKAGVITFKCSVCGNYVDDFDETLPAADATYAIAVADAEAEPGATATAAITLTNTNYGEDGFSTLVYWDEALGEDGVDAVKGADVYGADDTFSFNGITAEDAASRLELAGIDFDTEGYCFAILFADTGDNDFTARTGSGTLATLTLTAPAAEGEYAYGLLNIDPPSYTYYNSDYKLYAEIDYEIADQIPATLTVAAAACEHANTHEVITTEPTCVDPGYKNIVCDICGEIVEENVEIPATGIHTPGEAAYEDIVEPADCTTPGSKNLVVRCTVCGAILESTPEEIPAPGHQPGEAAEENRVEPADCVTDGSYDLVVRCTVCGNIISSEPQVIEAPGHTPAADWVDDPEDDTKEVLLCTVCGEVLETRDKEQPIEDTIDVQLVLCSTLASGEIDNNARTIHVVSKKDSAKATLELRLAGYPFSIFTMSDEALAAGNNMKIGSTYYNEKTDAAGHRYMVSYAENGFEQEYTIEVDVDGKIYVYTVYVEFDHSPACDGVVPGYTANAELTGFDPENDHQINVVAQPGAEKVAFRLNKMAKGVTIGITGDNAPYLYQTTDGGETYQIYDRDNIIPNKIVYFQSRLAEPDTCEYDIIITYPNGESEVYHVIATFPEVIVDETEG